MNAFAFYLLTIDWPLCHWEDTTGCTYHCCSITTTCHSAPAVPVCHYCLLSSLSTSVLVRPDTSCLCLGYCLVFSLLLSLSLIPQLPFLKLPLSSYNISSLFSPCWRIFSVSFLHLFCLVWFPCCFVLALVLETGRQDCWPLLSFLISPSLRPVHDTAHLFGWVCLHRHALFCLATVAFPHWYLWFFCVCCLAFTFRLVLLLHSALYLFMLTFWGVLHAAFLAPCVCVGVWWAARAWLWFAPFCCYLLMVVVTDACCSSQYRKDLYCHLGSSLESDQLRWATIYTCILESITIWWYWFMFVLCIYHAHCAHYWSCSLCILLVVGCVVCGETYPDGR